MTKNIKQTIIASVIIIISFFGFKMFFVDNKVDDTSLVADNATATQFVDGQVILKLLDDLNKVVLDDSIFSNKVFISLVSFGRPLQEQISGRPNPFLPIGAENSSIGSRNISTSTKNLPSIR